VTATTRGGRRTPDISLEPDPVIEACKRDLDRTLLRANLRRTVEQRVVALTALHRLATEARRAGGREARRRAPAP
jgi:hypothetical protein